MKKLVLTKSEAKSFRGKASELLKKIDLGIKQQATKDIDKPIDVIEFSVDFIQDEKVESYVKSLLIEEYEWVDARFFRGERGLLFVRLPW